MGSRGEAPEPLPKAAQLLEAPAPAQRPLLGVTGLRYDSQKLHQALSRGETQSHENRGGWRGGSENLSPPSHPRFLHLFRAPGWVGGVELLRNYSAINLHPTVLSVNGLGKHLSHLENISSVETENTVS